MRSKTSYFNETVFWKNITHFWPVWLIYTILLLCMVPLRLLVNSGISYEGYSAQEIKEIKMNNFYADPVFGWKWCAYSTP